MNISILTVFEKLYSPFIQTSLIGRAIEHKLIAVDVVSYFSLVAPKERIDAPIFGHGSGMLLKPEIVQKGIEQQEKKYGTATKIFFSPQGKKLDQRLLKTIFDQLQNSKHLMLLPARYEGMDTRVEEHYADITVSVGDFVLMGGDIPAMMLMEGLLRYLPGIVGKEESVREESFSGPFVDFPTFAPPVVWQGYEVPEVVRSGNHAAQDAWRRAQAIEKTVFHHFEWLRSYPLDQHDRTAVQRVIPPHYLVLMHSQVYIGPEEQLGTTSVTTMDVHDIARTCTTYGIKQFFIVTPLLDQQKVVQKLVDFWMSEEGLKYNASRQSALKQVSVVSSLDEVIAQIEQAEHKRPIVVSTSARPSGAEKSLTYYQQETAWASKAPLLLVFGTGRGLAHQVIEQSDYVLLPLQGLPPFNHLSVRAAVAIILDRWLGLNEKRPQ